MMEYLGNMGAGWMTETQKLCADSVVFSFGVGTDISWDLALIQKFGCTVHAFDPTPRSKEWLQSQQLPSQFIFHSYGLATHDGDMEFYDPPNPHNVSYSSVRKNGEPTLLPVKHLATIMRELQIDHIDILKMDIEGVEFLVLWNIRALPVKQLLVEFHDRFFKFGSIRRVIVILMLKLSGFKVVYKDARRRNYCFVRSA